MLILRGEKKRNKDRVLQQTKIPCYIIIMSSKTKFHIYTQNKTVNLHGIQKRLRKKFHFHMIADMHFCMRPTITSALSRATDHSLVVFTIGRLLQTLVLNMSLKSVLHHNKLSTLIHHFPTMNSASPTTDWVNSDIPTTLLVNHMESS